MTKPRFTIRTLLWCMIVVAVFFAGRESIRLPMSHERNSMREEIQALRDQHAQTENRLAIRAAQVMELQAELNVVKANQASD